MKRKTVLALGLIAATSFGGAIALPVLASGSEGQGGMSGHQSHGGQDGMMGQGKHGGAGGQSGQGKMSPHMMQMMMRMHSKMAGGMMGGGMMDNAMHSSFDTDGDGRISPEEMRAGQAAKLKQYDADGDGNLSLDEFEALHSAAFREKMVDRFQALDNDGDGLVTSEEMAAQADKMERMQSMRAQQGQGGKKNHGAMMGSDAGASDDNN